MATGRRQLKVIPGGGARGGGPGAASSAIGPEEKTAARRGTAAGAGDGGLRELYGKYGGGVYGRCYFLLKDRAKAEDAMQDVFAKALVNMAGFRAEASPSTWLIKIATNHCLNLLRSDRAAWHQTFADEELARAERARSEGPASGPRLFEDREAVRKLLEKVDIETQAAAIHYYVDEMTLEEVAAALGRSVPTIRKRLETFAARGGVEEVP
jgi:RNA polymerase sigma-70 factor (ECF subfamily)